MVAIFTVRGRPRYGCDCYASPRPPPRYHRHPEPLTGATRHKNFLKRLRPNARKLYTVKSKFLERYNAAATRRLKAKLKEHTKETSVAFAPKVGDSVVACVQLQMQPGDPVQTVITRPVPVKGVYNVTATNKPHTVVVVYLKGYKCALRGRWVPGRHVAAALDQIVKAQHFKQ
jgi:hypothetical protein